MGDGQSDTRENAMFHTLASHLRRYDYTLAAIKASLVLALLMIALMTLNGLVW
jgi:hypothetical protein